MRIVRIASAIQFYEQSNNLLFGSKANRESGDSIAQLIQSKFLTSNSFWPRCLYKKAINLKRHQQAVLESNTFSTAGTHTVHAVKR